MRVLLVCWLAAILSVVRSEDSATLDDFKLDEDFDESTLGDLDDSITSPPSVSSQTTAAPVPTQPYKPPQSAGLLFAETFDGDVFSRWIKSRTEKFSGAWNAAKREIEALVGDVGLRIMDAAKHHGIATKIPALTNNAGKELIVSYEAKFEEGLFCGGAYLKLFHQDKLSAPQDLASFDNETPYVIMFGPDVCGATNKVHLIIKHQNPISKEWVEHHLVNPPRVPGGKETHVYAFHLSPDNTYRVLIDGVVAKEGSMTTDFDPPFTPPKEVDDPTDTKPSDWVDAAKIPDPAATKPDDWDEDAPVMIPDPNAVKPDDWLENEERMIPDPKAKQPETWDEEEDGPWNAPLVANPACADVSGCGPWVPPSIPNPNFKGKWTAPLIDNPDYKGPWAPRKIPNVNYFVNENPHAVADINGVGFELWTMQSGILFDNIAIARSMDPIKAFVDATWKIRNPIETSQAKAAASTAEMNALKAESIPMKEKLMNTVMIVAASYPIPCALGVVAIVLLVMGILSKFFKTTKPQAAAAPEPPTSTSEPTTEQASPKEGTESEELKDKDEKAATTRKRATKKD